MARENITLQDLQTFKVEILNELEACFVKNIQPQKEILRSAEVRKLLGISPGTLQNLRISGTLKYSKVQGLLFYKTSDIQELLKQNESTPTP